MNTKTHVASHCLICGGRRGFNTNTDKVCESTRACIEELMREVNSVQKLLDNSVQKLLD